MARGLWRSAAAGAPVADDELGALANSFGELGLQMDAIVGHLLRAERLSATALISKRLNAELTPALDALRGAVAELHAGHIAAPERLAASVAQAAAAILSALHELDAPFVALPNGGREHRLRRHR